MLKMMSGQVRSAVRRALAGWLTLQVLFIPVPARAQATPDTAPGVLTLSRTGTNVGEPLAPSQRKTATAAEDALIALVNATGHGADVNEPLAADGGPPLIRGYRRTGTFRGHDVYDGDCVFITASGLPPLVPVTRERYLSVKIAEMRRSSARHAAQQQAGGTTVMSDHYAQFLRDRPKREAEMRKVYDEIKKSDPASADKMMEEWKKAEAESEQQIRAANGGADLDRQIQSARAEGNAAAAGAIQSLQSELEAMSPADRRRAAFVVDLGVGQTRLAGEDDTETTPLVQVNEAAYDKALGLEAPQAISVCLPGLQEGFPKDDREWTPQRARDAILIRDGLDWASLEAMVNRKQN